MTLRFRYIPLIIGAMVIMTACNNGPKVIEPTKTGSSQDSSTPLQSNGDESSETKLHSVVINEILPTKRYVYLKVKEGQEEFWIATGKMDVKRGGTYFYRGGLLKTDFESEEHDRVFERIYLVSNLVSKEDHTALAKTKPKNNSVMDKGIMQKENIPTHTEKEVQHMGSIKIAELIKDPKKYEGHSVEISGTCVKANPSILGRNWLHLQDGSQNDYDLVVTSNTLVPEGSDITVRAVVALNRDFGAGYTYELILENGTLVE
ncbi:hypothetical protein [Ulvibacterium sp.]|uniref:hypothetical protein n=1 Tax=Ulvibacterium sp. TaxID=2665914 RepID=UPI003BABDF51